MSMALLEQEHIAKLRSLQEAVLAALDDEPAECESESEANIYIKISE